MQREYGKSDAWDQMSLYIVKDVWVEDGHILEHAIFEAILNDVSEKYGTGILNQVASHLLIPTAHWLVQVRDEVDHTSQVMMRGYQPRFKDRLKIGISGVGDMDHPGAEDSAGDVIIQGMERPIVRAPLPWSCRKLKVVHRRHHRIVFREVAQTLYATRNLPEIFTVIKRQHEW